MPGRNFALVRNYWGESMRFTYDEIADAMYIYLVDPIAPGQAVDTLPLETERGHKEMFIDVDANGKILGIEIQGASRVLGAGALVQRPASRPPLVRRVWSAIFG